MVNMRSVCFITVVLVISVLCDFTIGNFQSDIDKCRPEQVHLSYGESAAEMIVMWSTTGQCSTSVHFGSEPFRLSEISPGESRLFSGPWNKNGAQYLHRVKLRGLTPNTMHYYQPMSNDIPVGPYFFKTPPAYSGTSDKSNSSDNHDEDIEFLLLGDLKLSSPVYSSLRMEVSNGNYHAILQPGNIGMNLSGADGKDGDTFMKMMEPVLKFVPFMVSPGPSEIDNGTFFHYQHRFSMPFTEWPMTTDRMWYSLDIGPVHLVSFSTEVFFTDGGKYAPAQHNWLLKDLKVANENRQKTPWIIAFGHHPMYCASEDPSLKCNKEKSEIALKLEDIMYHYGVDVVISSYGQSYEVSYPMYKGVKVADNYTHPLAPIHITLGSASPWTSTNNFTKGDWLNYLNEDETPLKFGRLKVHNSSQLHFDIVTFEGYHVVESFHIVQPEHKRFSKDELPANISAKIDKKIVVSGGEPGNMNIQEATSPKPVNTISETIDKIIHGDDKTKILIGGSVFGGILFIIVIVLVIRRVNRSRRRHASRRWENMDINYGKRYYNKAPEKDELDNDNDFEIDMTETSAPSRKLLSDD